MSEEWRAIPGWEGLYEVSDQGRVRTLGRVRVMRDGRRMVKLPRIMATTLSGRGYRSLRLSDGDRRETRKVSVLVAAAFIGPRPEGMLVRHLDDVKTNDVPSNLAYGTDSENQRDSVLNRRHGNTKKTQCPRGHAYDYTKPDGSRVCRKCKALHRSKNPRFLTESRAA